MNIKRWLNVVRDMLLSRRPKVLKGQRKGPAAWLGFEVLEDRVVPQASNYSQEFVTQLYTDLLHRAVDSTGLSFWSGQLADMQSPDSVALSIMQSPEYRNDLVSQIYQTYLDRTPDQPGQEFWAGQLGTNSVEVVEAQIIGSQEFFNDAGDSNAGFLERLYHDALSRGLDASGWATYGGMLNSGASRASIAYDILSSPEYRTDLIESYYETFLHRPADPSGLSFWVGQLDGGASDQSVIAGIVSSAEYAVRAPGVPTITSPTSALTTTDTSYSITGLAESGDLVQVFDSTGKVVGSEQLTGTQTDFSISVPLTSNEANNFEVAQTNGFGQESAKVTVPTITQGSTEVSVTAPARQTDDEGTTITPVTVTATDSKSNALTYTATNLPAGLTIGSSTGVISGSITSGDAASSPYSVTITATAAATGAKGTATFTWVVGTTNGITVTAPANQTDIEGGTVSLSITAKEDNNPLTYSATGLPTGLTINSTTGVISGTVAANDATASPYTVSVSATDSVNTGSATFDWTVTPAVVVTKPTEQSSAEGAAATLTVTATDHYNKSLTYSTTDLPGGLTINASTGKITGTITPADGASSPYTVTVSATDGTYSGSTTFTWTITSTITITNPGTQNDSEGTSLFLDIAAFDSASGKTLTYSATGLPSDLTIDSTTGKISGILQPGTAASSPYSVKVTVTDGTDTSNVTFDWDVTSPVSVTSPGNQTNVESNTVDLTITGTDTITGPTLSYSSSTLPGGLSISSSGVITGTVSNGDASGSPYTVTVTATDGTYSGSTTFDWTVTPAVVFTNPGTQTNVEGNSPTVTVAATDANASGILVYTSSSLPGGMAINPATGVITGTLSDTDATSSPYSVTVNASDGTYSASTTFSWVVKSPISITAIGNQSSSEGSAITLTATASDSAAGTTLTYAATNLPGGLSINSASGAITGTVSTGDASSSPYTMTVTASDGTFTPASTTFTWTVSSIVSIPNPGTQTSQEGAGISLAEAGTDKNGGTLSYSATGLPSGLTMDSSSGLIGGFVNSGDAASSPYTVTVTATDGTNSATTTFTWKVVPAVSITPVAEQANYVGDSVTLSVTASDGTTNTLSYSATGLPTGLTISGTTGLISGTIASTADSSSPYTATVTVTDPTTGAIDVANITWLVDAKADPLLMPPATQLSQNGDSITGVTVTATKANSTSVTYAASGLPSGLSIDKSTGAITGTIAASDSNTSPYTVTVTATEGTGSSSTAKFTWVVTSGSTSALPVSLTNPGWVSLSSGVRYLDVIPGSGTATAAGDTITVNYIGYLTDGTDFNSGNGFSSTLDSNHLIVGWVDGVPGMKPGGVRYLDIPASLAYGSSGSPPTIPANAELVFEISMDSN